jgi:hypothetical protein
MTSGSVLLTALSFPILIGAASAAPTATMTRARLEVRAAPECTSRADLAARIAARSPRIQFVDEAVLFAAVELTVLRPGQVVAELVLASVDGRPSPRQVVAPSCAEAADAVALIIAVSLDPTLTRTTGTASIRDQGATRDAEMLAQGRAAAKATSPEPSEPRGVRIVRPAQSPETFAQNPSLARPADAPIDNAIERPDVEAAPVERADPPENQPAPTRRGSGGAYLAGLTVLGPAPASMPGVAVYALASLDRESPWSPALFFGATHVWRSDLPELGGTASFALDAGSLDACPVRAGWASLAVRPCASLLVGRMTASGAGVDDATRAARLFAVAGGAVVLTVGIGTVVELTGRLATGLTLRRDSYGFAPRTFHRVDLLTTSASLGIGVRWP